VYSVKVRGGFRQRLVGPRVQRCVLADGAGLKCPRMNLFLFCEAAFLELAMLA
jgi:hypothetical protein